MFYFTIAPDSLPSLKGGGGGKKKENLIELVSKQAR
jgi:hypothetical protein